MANSISIKSARQQFAHVVKAAQNGRTVSITRRGKVVARVTPAAPARRSRLPDLSAFRASLGTPAARSRATIQHLRGQERH